MATSKKSELPITINKRQFKTYDELISFLNESFQRQIQGNDRLKCKMIKTLQSVKNALVNGQHLDIYESFLNAKFQYFLIEQLRDYIKSDDIELLRAMLSLLITITDNSFLTCKEFIETTDLAVILIEETIAVCSEDFKVKLPKSISVEDIVAQLILIIHNIARYDQFQQCFRRHDEIKLFKDRVIQFFGSKDKRTCILTMAVLTWLAEDNEEDIFIISHHTFVIDNFIEYVNKGLKDKSHWYEGMFVWELLLVLQSLSCMDSIKQSLFLTSKFMATILTILKSKSSTSREIEISLGICWNLYFVENNRHELRTKYNIKIAVDNLLHHTDDKVRDKARRFSKELENVEEKKSSKKTTAYDVFISYCHAQNNTVKQLVDEIKKKFKVWIDTEGIKGSGLNDMAVGIEQSKVIMMGVSNSYKQSQCCHSEASWAYRLKKPIIPLLMERKYKPDGWLGMMISTETYIDVSNLDNIAELVNKIEEHILHKCDKITTVNITVTLSTDNNNANKSIENTPTDSGRKLIDWSESEVNDWLLANDLEEVQPAFVKFNGKMVDSLRNMRTNSYKVYHSHMNEELHLTLQQILKLDSAISNLKI